METPPKTRTRRTLGGEQKTVTRSKYTDAAGTKVRERKVTKKVPSVKYRSDITKTITKRKFANGTTSKRKVKTVKSSSPDDNVTSVKDKISGLERVSLGPNKATSVKENVSGRGFRKKEKYGYSGPSYDPKPLSYRSAKRNQKEIKKGRRSSSIL